MAVPVLIITPVRSFGELIQQALHEIGRYRAEILALGTDALTRLKQTPVKLVILDYEIKDIQPQAFLKILNEGWPEIRVIAIPLDEGAELDSAAGLKLDARLPKPFYLPDLLDTVEALTRNLAAEPPAERAAPARNQPGAGDRPAPAWLVDVNLAAQHLTRLSLESSAQAALIARGDRIWAYAGQLPQPAAEELARSVNYHWASARGGSDYARFVRLDTVPGEYLLYATGLGGEFILALAFETELPFSSIRRQAGELARKLSSPPSAETTPPPSSPRVAPPPVAMPGASAPQPVQPEDWGPEESGLEDWGEVPPPDGLDFESDPGSNFPADWRPAGALAQGRHAFLDNLLATLDVPDPGLVNAAPAEDPLAAPRPVLPTVLPQAPRVTSPDTQRWLGPTDVDPVVDTAVNAAPAAGSGLQPPAPGLPPLHYACVLIPRLPAHHLVGDLAGMLNERFQRLCLAFGWRLEHLALRPDYLHWLVSAPPEVAPGVLIETIRRQTSNNIFAEFPHLAAENPSGDFWAAAYLLVSGDQPLPADVIRTFVHSTRTGQGLDPHKD